MQITFFLLFIFFISFSMGRRMGEGKRLALGDWLPTCKGRRTSSFWFDLAGHIISLKLYRNAEIRKLKRMLCQVVYGFFQYALSRTPYTKSRNWALAACPGGQYSGISNFLEFDDGHPLSPFLIFQGREASGAQPWTFSFQQLFFQYPFQCPLPIVFEELLEQSCSLFLF